MKKVFFLMCILSMFTMESQDLISGGSNSWIFHTPDNNGRTTLYIAPKTNGNWDWTKQSSFYNNGNVSFSGNLGVGITAPVTTLHIRGEANNTYMRIDDGTALINIGVDQTGSFFNTNRNYRFLTSSGTTEAMRISSSGNVGIGTTDTQGFKLGVNGDIAALEVKIATYANWPDYVFNDTYNLPALEEVEQQIKDKGHLKDIPSAEKVKEEGFYLGDMDAKLLQKIEELTLYTIKQQKEIKAQNNKIESQNSKIEKLEEENAELKSLSKRLTAIEALLNNQKQ